MFPKILHKKILYNIFLYYKIYVFVIIPDAQCHWVDTRYRFLEKRTQKLQKTSVFQLHYHVIAYSNMDRKHASNSILKVLLSEKSHPTSTMKPYLLLKIEIFL